MSYPKPPDAPLSGMVSGIAQGSLAQPRDGAGALGEDVSYPLLDEMLAGVSSAEPPSHLAMSVMRRIAVHNRRKRVLQRVRLGAYTVMVALMLTLGVLMLVSTASQSHPLLVDSLAGAMSQMTAVLRTLGLALGVVVRGFVGNGTVLVAAWIAVAALVTVVWLRIVALSQNGPMSV